MLAMPISKLYPAFMTKRAIIYAGCFFQIAAIYLISIEAKTAGMKKTLCIIGGILWGFGFGNISIKIMVEIIESIEDNWETQGANLNKENLYNQVAGYFTMCIGLGEMAGPATSSIINRKLSFHNTQWFLLAFILAYTLLYMLVCRFTNPERQ